jgi:hypothetical protein
MEALVQKEYFAELHSSMRMEEAFAGGTILILLLLHIIHSPGL